MNIIPIYSNTGIMNNIKTTAENIALTIINGIRDLISPFFQKYTSYYKYIDVIFYGTYALILFGFYNTIPEYIPTLRNTILYIAVVILLVRFNKISWNNPKFAVLGGNKFSEFDRRLIISTCIFILLTHIVSDSIANYTKDQVNKTVTQPVGTNIVNPIYNYIDTSGAVDKIPAVKKFLQEQTHTPAAQQTTPPPVPPA